MVSQVISLVDQNLYLLTPLQHFLDVLDHDVLDLVHLKRHITHISLFSS